MHFASKIVAASVTATSIYTAVMLWLAVYNIDHATNTWPPIELTTLFFAFWTVEIVMLASIRKSKIKNKYEKEDDDDKGRAD
jgi:hypothetical protein